MNTDKLLFECVDKVLNDNPHGVSMMYLVSKSMKDANIHISGFVSAKRTIEKHIASQLDLRVFTRNRSLIMRGKKDESPTSS